LRYFSLKNKEEIENIEARQSAQEIKRVFAEELTVRIHGQAVYESVLAVSKLLFDPKADTETLRSLGAATLAEVADEIPAPKMARSALQNGLNILDFLSEATGILESRSEAKRAIQANTISVNKQKIADLGVVITPADLLHGKFLMVENGKKNKYLVVVE
jgi:tyrosyl-tRNA synthetase